ncbi:MAG TPA: MarR family transcriptional regulator [Xanthomonadaceae bacterium]|nr:MarR family transcriptional regulator [Xanthomonadaceae bacterium]
MPSRNPTTVDATTLVFHQALSDLVRIYQYRDRDRICCHDISITQCHALEILVARGPLRSQALAEALRLDKSTVTRVVDALERKVYVERLADPSDARAVLLRTTGKGAGLYRRIHDELIVEEAALLGDLDPDVRAGATEVLRRLARAAERRFAPACTTACLPSESDARRCA